MAECPNCHTQNPEVGTRCPRCEDFFYIPEDAVEDAQTDPLIGRMTAGKYVILGLISEGGMGAVYRALQLPVEREVAFKVLRTELKDSDNGRDRFIREARAVSRLNHPNIITLYDFGFDDGKHPYMVMEYAPGNSLGKWHKQEGVTMDRILRVTAQILSALTEAHSRGIVHRDLKPENMIVSQRGNDPDYVKLLDFGIARLINEGATRGLTREGEVFGTPHYMAPEQAQGKKELGPPADIYAVGIMMWEMICGECPFDAPTPLTVLFMHISDPLPPLKPKPGVFPTPDVERIVQRAGAKAPEDRYQSAAEMLNDILTLIGFTTGALPGMIHTEGSAEFALTGAGSAVTAASQAAFRQPHFTPSPGSIGSGVHVTDPEASFIATPFQTGEHEQIAAAAAANKRLGIIAAVAVVAVLGACAALYVVAFSEPAVAEGGVEQPETPEVTTAVATTEKIEAIKIEPIAEEPEEEPEEVEIVEPEEETPPPEVAEKPAETKPVQKPKTVEKKPAQTKKVQKKTETRPTKTESVKPGKWTVKPKRWD